MGKCALQPLPTGQQQYMVVGRFVPNAKYGETAPMCKVYRMKLFAKNVVCARSRFWYFMGRLCRVKKANGQIIAVNEVRTVPAAQAQLGWKQRLRGAWGGFGVGQRWPDRGAGRGLCGARSGGAPADPGVVSVAAAGPHTVPAVQASVDGDADCGPALQLGSVLQHWGAACVLGRANPCDSDSHTRLPSPALRRSLRRSRCG